ncbi:hypothetical protein C0J52_03047 [Blattella germanica]|nr:hypothetical protein C0J52_03047 [Blattella germanica]
MEVLISMASSSVFNAKGVFDYLGFSPVCIALSLKFFLKCRQALSGFADHFSLPFEIIIINFFSIFLYIH